MKLVKEKNMNILIADENKHIRDVNDTYKEKTQDNEGNIIEEHIPYYSTKIYLPLDITEEDISKLYVEEDILNGDGNIE